MHRRKGVLLSFVQWNLENRWCWFNGIPKAFLECREMVIEDVLDVLELAKLHTSSFLAGGYKILKFDVKDGVSALTFWF